MANGLEWKKMPPPSKFYVIIDGNMISCNTAHRLKDHYGTYSVFPQDYTRTKYIIQSNQLVANPNADRDAQILHQYALCTYTSSDKDDAEWNMAKYYGSSEMYDATTTMYEHYSDLYDELAAELVQEEAVYQQMIEDAADDNA